ncbi:uncharacterized protein CEXT_342171 [Caerostris extrusa]|uniref:Uncharacterized protein n=1 Tax=Caerostris extrusa TaxID=172846 RepID=A0AAV4UW39_CAEEX|nr:uncharacterized protein CEXT_342171 [Caerostris extrusa]
MLYRPLGVNNDHLKDHRIQWHNTRTSCLRGLHIVKADDNTVGMDLFPNSTSPSNWYRDLLLNGVTNKSYQTWILSILASCVVGLSGIVPLIFVRMDNSSKLQQQEASYSISLAFNKIIQLQIIRLHVFPYQISKEVGTSLFIVSEHVAETPL